MNINAAWHLKNKMPKNPTIEERIKWHLSHEKNCQCRPISGKLLDEMKRRGIKTGVKKKTSKIVKAKRYSESIVFLEQIPNIGPALVRDLNLVGIKHPKDLKKYSAFELYTKLKEKTGVWHDPCVLDTFMAAVDFVNGAPARPWWKYTKERKKVFRTNDPRKN